MPEISQEEEDFRLALAALACKCGFSCDMPPSHIQLISCSSSSPYYNGSYPLTLEIRYRPALDDRVSGAHFDAEATVEEEPLELNVGERVDGEPT